jgi:hypothetical protein
MSFDFALRLTEILLAVAFIQQSLEHMVSTPETRWLFGIRLVASTALMFGLAPDLMLLVLTALSMVALHIFQGPYNGGSDRMSVLILWCLIIANWVPDPLWQELVFSYLALQLTLSYFISGWVKLVNTDWRSGRALSDVFGFSAYPVSENLRGLAQFPRLMCALSWGVIAFEVAFPLALFTPFSLIAALAIAACFHLANASLFGLNRFFWIWLAAYPSLIWFQDRVF